MISCPTCGVVMDEEKTPVKVETFKGVQQSSIYCPVCEKLAARTLDGEEVKVNCARPHVAPVAKLADDEPE